jgi:hypothetical protein
MPSSRKIYLYRDFAAGVCLSQAQNLIIYPLYTLYMCLQYNYSHSEGKREVELNQRES